MLSRRLAVLVAAVSVVSVAGCTTNSGDQPPTTVTEYVTASPSTSPPSSSSAPATSGANSATLQASWVKLSRNLAQPVSVAVVGVGDAPGEPLVFGANQVPAQVAWSTIKVPLAIAAERENGPQTATSAAITQSDNASAEALWTSLGGGTQASNAVEKVLRENGSQAQVPSTAQRAGFTVFGQTLWPVLDAATFTAHLPCLPDAAAKRVVGYMGNVAGNQQWGVEVMAKPKATAVKGGWGPGATSGYVVRQIGFITLANGDKTAIAMTTFAPGTSLGSGTAVLNQVAKWLNKNVASLPHGKCSAGR